MTKHDRTNTGQTNVINNPLPLTLLPECHVLVTLYFDTTILTNDWVFELNCIHSV